MDDFIFLHVKQDRLNEIDDQVWNQRFQPTANTVLNYPSPLSSLLSISSKCNASSGKDIDVFSKQLATASCRAN